MLMYFFGRKNLALVFWNFKGQRLLKKLKNREKDLTGVREAGLLWGTDKRGLEELQIEAQPVRCLNTQ